MDITKDKLKKILQTDDLTVMFTKKDGTNRIMNCTLREVHLPLSMQKESTRKENVDVLSVWDLDVKDWRSFRIDSIKDYSVTSQYGQYEFNYDRPRDLGRLIDF